VIAVKEVITMMLEGSGGELRVSKTASKHR